MKRCPACNKTFADGMKFCQTDGTLLVEDAPPADPYKTVVGNQSDIASAIPPLDPFKTMVASPPKAVEEDLLQLPDEPDLAKTMMVSQDELNKESKAGGVGDVPPLDLSPMPSAPLIEPKPAAPNDFPSPPKSNEPSLRPPNFGDSGYESGLPKPSETHSSDATAARDSGISRENPPSPFDSKPFQNDFSMQSPYGNQENKPIPSPFQDSLPPLYQSPFQPPTPFGQPESYNQPMVQSGWTPPPAPASEWQNQNIGQNTSFQPPAAGNGQNQTLAIISLVCGVLSIFCCGWIVPGIAAVALGFIAKNKADQNPNEYGGRGLALGGIITGGISLVLGIIVLILYFFTGLLAGVGNL